MPPKCTLNREPSMGAYMTNKGSKFGKITKNKVKSMVVPRTSFHGKYLHICQIIKKVEIETALYE